MLNVERFIAASDGRYLFSQGTGEDTNIHSHCYGPLISPDEWREENCQKSI